MVDWLTCDNGYTLTIAMVSAVSLRLKAHGRNQTLKGQTITSRAVRGDSGRVSRPDRPFKVRLLP